MNLKLQRRLAADVLDGSENRIKMDPARLKEIDEALTKTDIRELIGDGAIWLEQKKGNSRARANHNQKQKSKGRQKNEGSRKGTPKARQSQKKRWANSVRAQRSLLKDMKNKEIISKDTYKRLYKMVKGGYFRSKRHIKLFIRERGLAEEEDNE